MSYIFFDTETTGLDDDDRIIQLSYIITDKKLNILGARNYFFDVDEISVGATAIHGIDKEKIVKLSGGKRFEDYAKDVLWDFQNANVICHNASFDTKFFRREFAHLGKKLVLNKIFCTMENYTDIICIPHNYFGMKWPKLEEVVEFLELDMETLKSKATDVFKEDAVAFHDARLDVYTTYEIYKRLKYNIMQNYINEIQEQVKELTVESGLSRVRKIISDLKEYKNIAAKLDEFRGEEETIIDFKPTKDDDIPF